MRMIDEKSAEAYLRDTGRISPGASVRVSELSGGVSNMVLLVECGESPQADFVLKQAREQLRTAQPWFSSLERIWREAQVMNACARLLETARFAAGPAAQTPRILFEDRENYLFAMTAAPRPYTTWKAELLADRTDREVAVACGRLLATLHGGSWHDARLADQLGDRTLFEQLRIDPYYRTLATVQPDAAGAIDALVRSLADHARCLVLGDFSPKNLLISAGGLMMVDFETGHYGDPAFDLGFFLSHLVLKACHKRPRHSAYLALSDAFWTTYCATIAPHIATAEMRALRRRAILNFAGCGWARLDAKSPVEYLVDPLRRESMRQLCREILSTEPTDWPEVVALCHQRFDPP